jgi:hypothetical protein
MHYYVTEGIKHNKEKKKLVNRISPNAMASRQIKSFINQYPSKGCILE